MTESSGLSEPLPIAKPPAAAVSAPTGPLGPPRDHGHGAWQTSRVIRSGREWLRVEWSANGDGPGEAWAPYCKHLVEQLDRSHAQPPAVPESWAGAAGSDSDGVARLAEGLIATARANAQCRRHQLPLHLFLGGPIRDPIAVTLPLRFDAAENGTRAADVRQQCEGIREAALTYGVSSFAVHDASADVDHIAEASAAVRRTVGPEARLTLRLNRQLSEAAARALVGLVRGLDLLCVTDPCATIPLSVAATEGGLPALGLTAAAYDRTSLLQCFVSAPPTVLYVDPLLEGGPYAARQLAGVARVLQVDVALSAMAGEDWLTTHCAELASVFPACRQPVELPSSWTVATLRALHVRAGALALAELWPRPLGHPSTSSGDEPLPR